MSLDVRQLRLFAEVAAAGSVRLAAQRLNMAQSALSRRMQQLELDVGMALFQRRTDGVRLTEAGQRLIRRADRLLQEYDRLCDELAVDRAAHATRIRLGVTASAASLILGGVLARIHEQVPGILFQVIEGGSEHLHAWVMSGEVDLALVTNPRPTKSLEMLQMWRESVFLVGPALCGGSGPLTFDDVIHLPFILTSRGAGIKTMFEQAFARAGHRLRVDMEVEAVTSAKRLVESGAAFTILPFPPIAQEVREGRLRAARIPGADFQRGLVRRAGAPMTRTTRQLIAVLMAEVESQLSGLDWAEMRVSGPGQDWRPLGARQPS